MSHSEVEVSSDEDYVKSSDGDDRAARAEERLAVPVLVAAIASIPATFLTTLEGRPQLAGHVVNYLSVAVLAGESVVPFVLASHRIRWLRERWFVVAVAAISVPAVIFAVGPAQLLRLVRFVGALRILRVRRILKAGKILRQRSGRTGWQWKAISAFLSLLAAAFVAIVLSDPSSQTRQLAEGALGQFGLPAIILAGAIIASATFLVLRYGRKSQD